MGRIVELLNAVFNNLPSKLKVGALLKLKVEAHGLEIIGSGTADENYTMEWVRNTAAIAQLLVD